MSGWPDTETYIRAHADDGVQAVEYTMMPYIARELAYLLREKANATGDSGFGEDADALFAAADEADEL